MKFFQTYRIAALSTLFGMLLMGYGGCKQTEQKPTMEEERQTVRTGSDDVPADLKIIFGQQGTFAGRGMGYSINAGGEVLRWEGKYPEENTEASATVDAAHVQRLWKYAQEIGFLEIQEQAMATVNNFITLTAGGESRRVTWVQRDEDALTPAQKFYDECMVVAKTALGEESGTKGG